MSQFDDMVLNMTQTTPEPEDYTGEDGLLYCGKCRKPKEAYFPEGKSLFGRIRPLSLAVTATRQSATASGQSGKSGKPPRSGAPTLKLLSV